MAVRATADRAMPRSRELLHGLVQNASDLILIVTPEGAIRDATGAVHEVLGGRAAGVSGRALGGVGGGPAELTGPALVDLVRPHDCVLLNGLMTGALAGGPCATERIG